MLPKKVCCAAEIVLRAAAGFSDSALNPAPSCPDATLQKADRGVKALGNPKWLRTKLKSWPTTLLQRSTDQADTAEEI
jgi:hypothetical protein